jgi:hypothetical protein
LEIISEIAENEGEPGYFKYIFFFSTDKKMKTLSRFELRAREALGLNNKRQTRNILSILEIKVLLDIPWTTWYETGTS